MGINAKGLKKKKTKCNKQKGSCESVTKTEIFAIFIAMGIFITPFSQSFVGGFRCFYYYLLLLLLANVEQFQPNYNTKTTTKLTRHESPCGHHVAKKKKKLHGRVKRGRS